MHAGLAYISAEHDTLKLRHKLLQPSRELPPDQLLAAAFSDSNVHLFPSVLDKCTALMNNPAPIRHAQRDLSQEFERCEFEEYIASLAQDDAARVRSCGSPHASSWLLPYDSTYGTENSWLGNAEFSVLCRHRLGRTVAEHPSLCRLCGKMEADVHGHHALMCMGSGLRTRAHHSPRDAIYDIAGTAQRISGGCCRGSGGVIGVGERVGVGCGGAD
jgi:hypothetical protein